jgi:hypothetical protein
MNFQTEDRSFIMSDIFTVANLNLQDKNFSTENLRGKILTCAYARGKKYEYFALVDRVTGIPLSVGRSETGYAVGELLDMLNPNTVSRPEVNDMFQWIRRFLDSPQELNTTLSPELMLEVVRGLYDNVCFYFAAQTKSERPCRNLLLTLFFAKWFNLVMSCAEFGSQQMEFRPEYEAFEQASEMFRDPDIRLKEFLWDGTLSFKLLIRGDFENQKFGEKYTEDVPEFWFIPRTTRDLLNFMLADYRLHNISFRKCKYCGRYFVQTAGYKADYCERTIEGFSYGKTCRANGKALAHGKRVMDDPIKGAYTRAYQAHYNRVRRSLMSSEEFEAWKMQAQSMRDKCLRGLISLQELTDWLNQDRLRETKK